MMYKYGLSLLILLSFSLSSLALHVELSGLVLDSSAGNQPLEGVLVKHNQQGSTLTDQQGRFYFQHLEAGIIFLEFRYLGYQPKLVQVNLEESRFITVYLVKAPRTLQHATVIAPRLSLPDGLDLVQPERTRGQSIADWVNRMPGGAVLQTGPAIVKPVFRGLHSQRLVVLNDQARMEGQQWGADHGLETDPMNAGTVAFLDMVQSLTRGAEAVGGAMEIIPVPFLTRPGNASRFSLQGFSNNWQGAAGWLQQYADSNHRYWNLSLSVRRAGDSRTPDYRMTNTGFSLINGAFRFHKDLGENSYREFSLSHYQGNIGILQSAHIGNTTDLQAAIARGRPAVQQPFSYKIDRPRQYVMHSLGRFTYNRRFSLRNGVLNKKHQLVVQRSQRTEYDRINPLFSSATSRPNFDLWLYVLQYERILSFNSSKFRLDRGYGLFGHWNTNYGKGQLIPDYYLLNAQGWLYAKGRFRNWKWSGSGRLDLRQQWAYVPLFFGSNQLKQRRFLTPGLALGASRSLLGLEMALNMKFSARAPWINELYAKGLHGGTASFELGDERLKQEWLGQTELLLTKRLKNFHASFSAFYRHAWNYIYQQPQPTTTLTILGAFPTFQFTQARVQWYGTELSLNWQPLVWFNWLGTAQFMRAWNFTTNTPLIFMPANRLRSELVLKGVSGSWLQDWQFSFGVWAVDRQQRFPAGVDYANPPAGYVLLDLSLQKSWQLQKGTLLLQLSGQNLGNKRYRDYLNRLRYFSEEQGINFSLKLVYQFKNLKK